MPLLGSILKRGLRIGERIDEQFEQVPPGQHQYRTLRRLLKKAQHTAFGQYYNYRELLRSSSMVDDFRSRVPIFDYDTMYDKWWHMSLNNVEDVSWRGRTRYFALSSGTSGAASKHIPITDDMRRAMRRASLKMFLALANFDVSPDILTKGMLMLGGTSDLQDQGGYYAGDLSGINASKPPFWLRPYYKPGTRIARINNWDDRIEEIAKQAPTWDIGFLVGIPSWLQLMMERIIDFHKVDTIHDIWPNLEVFVHGGIHFEPLKASFESLLARPLVYMDSYLASEGFIAYQDRPDTRAMRLLLHNGIFFEFIPFTEDNFDLEGGIIGAPEALTIDQVEEGKQYALLISTCAGAWRYLLGDTIEFTDKGRSEIIITGRTKHFLSVCGEHLSVDNMNAGIEQLNEQMDLKIREYTVIPEPTENYYRHTWFIGTESPQTDRLKAGELLDKVLSRVNDDYATERSSLLRSPHIVFLPNDAFYAFQRTLNKLGGQNKFPRVLNKNQHQDWQSFVEQWRPLN